MDIPYRRFEIVVKKAGEDAPYTANYYGHHTVEAVFQTFDFDDPRIEWFAIKDLDKCNNADVEKVLNKR